MPRTPVQQASPETNISFMLDRMTRWVGNHPAFWKRLGDIESGHLEERLKDIPISAPVYIGGLARAGSTFLLECLATHKDAVTHRYRDFPFIFTPYGWNRALDFQPRQKQKPRERAHADGMFVTPESPEAMEEMLWMHFFPQLHREGDSGILDGLTSNKEFEDFYRAHLKKMMLVRRKPRYVAKGNYLAARFEYLLTLFPDARFIVPVRDPVTHIASLMRQHKHFSAIHASHPRTLYQMQVAGHFEFGADRRASHVADSTVAQEVVACWKAGKEAEGWAFYWNSLYGYLLKRRSESPALANALLIVRHEDVCRQPLYTLQRVFSHANLPVTEKDLQSIAQAVAPRDMRVDLPEQDIKTIHAITRKNAALLNYPAS